MRGSRLSPGVAFADLARALRYFKERRAKRLCLSGTSRIGVPVAWDRNPLEADASPGVASRSAACRPGLGAALPLDPCSGCRPTKAKFQAERETILMRISIFGLGYVGTVSAGCLAREGHQIIGVDPVGTKIDLINNGRTPIIEANISEIIASAVQAGRLLATSDANEAIRR